MSTATVVVGCKLPNGYICCLGIDLKTGQKTDRYREIKLNGGNTSLIRGVDNRPLDSGYGFTENVDAEFMTEWLKAYKWHPAVKNGLIFVEADLASAKARATENAAVKTGLEALDAKKLPKRLEAAAAAM